MKTILVAEKKNSKASKKRKEEEYLKAQDPTDKKLGHELYKQGQAF